jgi:hypothetical protein
MTGTPLEELCKPHPDQKRIDAEAAALLRKTGLEMGILQPETQTGTSEHESRRRTAA